MKDSILKFPASPLWIPGIDALLFSVLVLSMPLAWAQSWVPTETPAQGGYVRGLVIPSLSSSSSTGDSWVGIHHGGMYKRTAGSDTWTAMNNGLTDKRVFGFAVKTNVTPFRGYVATRGGGVFRTSDGGANWVPLNNGLGCVYVRTIMAVFGASESTDTLVAGTECTSSSGVYFSFNGGESWSISTGIPQNAIVHSVTRVFVAATSSKPAIDYGVASTDQGVYKSTADGQTWIASNGSMVGPNGPVVYNVAWTNSATNGIRMVASVEGSGVWRSDDKGASWGDAPVLNTVPNSGISTDRDGNFYVTTDTDGVYKSADNGKTWAQWVTNAALPGARSISRSSVVSGSPLYFAQTLAGVYQSSDSGATWTKSSMGLPGGYAVNSAFSSSGEVYTAFAEGVFKKASSDAAWQRVGGTNLGSLQSGGTLTMSPTDVPYLVTSRSGVFRFDGSQWVAMNVGLPNLVGQGGVIRVDPASASGFYLGLTGRGMYYSSDSGSSWNAINNGLTGDALWIRHVWATASLVVITSNDGVYKSVDAGANWIRLSFPPKSPGGTELRGDHVVIDPANNAIYVAVYQTDPAGATYSGSGLWKSTDAGSTWTQSLAGRRVHEIKVVRDNNAATLYAGIWDDTDIVHVMPGGAYKSTDDGVTWTAINSGLTDNHISSFGIFSNAVKTVSTFGNGVFQLVPAAIDPNDCLFNWAELNYAPLFAPSGASSMSFGPYYLRYYSRTIAYLGVAENKLFYLGPLSSNSLLDLGAVSPWYKTAGCS